MGDKDREPFQLSFNVLKVDFQGARVTSDGGLLLIRELDERLGLGKLIDDHLIDMRQGENTKFPLAPLRRARLAKIGGSNVEEARKTLLCSRVSPMLTVAKRPKRKSWYI